MSAPHPSQSVAGSYVSVTAGRQAWGLHTLWNTLCAIWYAGSSQKFLIISVLINIPQTKCFNHQKHIYFLGCAHIPPGKWHLFSFISVCYFSFTNLIWPYAFLQMQCDNMKNIYSNYILNCLCYPIFLLITHLGV